MNTSPSPETLAMLAALAAVCLFLLFVVVVAGIGVFLMIRSRRRPPAGTLPVPPPVPLPSSPPPPVTGKENWGDEHLAVIGMEYHPNCVDFAGHTFNYLWCPWHTIHGRGTVTIRNVGTESITSFFVTLSAFTANGDLSESKVLTGMCLPPGRNCTLEIAPLGKHGVAMEVTHVSYTLARGGRMVMVDLHHPADPTPALV